jgi:hypothetical protein
MLEALRGSGRIDEQPPEILREVASHRKRDLLPPAGRTGPRGHASHPYMYPADLLDLVDKDKILGGPEDGMNREGDLAGSAFSWITALAIGMADILSVRPRTFL